MAQVYMFPVEKKLPKHIEEDIYKNAKEYVELLQASMMLLGKEGIDQMEYEEILELVTATYIDGLHYAMNTLDES